MYTGQGSWTSKFCPRISPAPKLSVWTLKYVNSVLFVRMSLFESELQKKKSREGEERE
jgi:hypothetical protein